MSRTYKDKPSKYKYLPWDIDYIGFGLRKPTSRLKKRRELDTEEHWMTTPMWWIRLMMNKPQRRKGAVWEHEVVKLSKPELEEVDLPSISRKPHSYFW